MLSRVIPNHPTTRNTQIINFYSGLVSRRGVAQLASALGLGPRGRRFETGHPEGIRVTCFGNGSPSRTLFSQEFPVVCHPLATILAFKTRRLSDLPLNWRSVRRRSQNHVKKGRLQKSLTGTPASILDRHPRAHLWKATVETRLSGIVGGLRGRCPSEKNQRPSRLLL